MTAKQIHSHAVGRDLKSTAPRPWCERAYERSVAGSQLSGTKVGGEGDVVPLV